MAQSELPYAFVAKGTVADADLDQPEQKLRWVIIAIDSKVVRGRRYDTLTGGRTGTAKRWPYCNDR